MNVKIESQQIKGTRPEEKRIQVKVFLGEPSKWRMTGVCYMTEEEYLCFSDVISTTSIIKGTQTYIIGYNPQKEIDDLLNGELNY